MKSLLKKILSPEGALYKNLSYLYHYKSQHWRPKIIPNFEKILEAYVAKKGSFTFVQVGSNNGMSNDPIYPLANKYKCKGVFIEPVPYLFEQLKNNHTPKEGLYFENIAIGKESGYFPFYTVKESNDPSLPPWYSQLSSFSYETLISHKQWIPQLEELIEKQDIKAEPLTYIFEKYQFKTLDILHTDTEGYDYEILKTMDFSKLCPAILLFENKHLKDPDYKLLLQTLHKYYAKIVRNDSGDTLCYEKK